MSKRKGLRLLTVFVLCVLMVCSLSVTAFAGADDTPQELPVTGGAEPETVPETEPVETTPETEPETEIEPEALTPGEAFYDPGNAYTRDRFMMKLQTNSLSPSRRKTAIPFTSSLIMTRPSTKKKNSTRPIS